MDRIIDPLSSVGARIRSEDSFLPIEIHSSKNLTPINQELKLPSAQIKSALILYAISIKGESKITGLTNTRDHLERMLKYINYPIKINGNEIRILGDININKNLNINLPGDISSASFLICAAILSTNSNLQIMNICINKYRVGFVEVACKMGANIEITNKRNINGESVGDIHVCNGPKFQPKILAYHSTFTETYYPYEMDQKKILLSWEALRDVVLHDFLNLEAYSY